MMTKKQRSSNLELYRIVCMLLIVAHHMVVNSSVIDVYEPIHGNDSLIGGGKTLYMMLLGMWGKTGINCFLLITGYFMCNSQITFRKLLKLMLWIYFYKIVIFSLFIVFSEYESLTPGRFIRLIMPIWSIQSNFTSCFIVFWLTIPFWNILVHRMTRYQHQLLLGLLLGVYSLLGSIPGFDVNFNYVTWFGVIYLIASYIRMYPYPFFENQKLWAGLSVLSIGLAIGTVVILAVVLEKDNVYFFVSDSNRLLAVSVAVSTFMWFKNLKMGYSKYVNMLGASTFGVLLIHANSDAMRTWLWKDVLDISGHYSLPLTHLVIYTIGMTFLVFGACVVIDFIRIRLIERPFFHWYDSKKVPVKD